MYNLDSYFQRKVVILNIVILDNDEEFIQHLDPELCSLTETIEKGGLRTLTLNYKFQDAVEDKKLFKLGVTCGLTLDTSQRL